jgi:hypothetical protein
MNWNTLVGVTATFAMFLPVAAIVYHRLYSHRSLLALLISYVNTALCNLMTEGILPVPFAMERVCSVIANYLEVPLMLTALLFFCPIRQKQRTVHIITALFVVYEIVIGVLFGLQTKAAVFIMGPGMLLILIYSFYLFLRHIKITVEFGKNAGRTLMLAGFLFSYGCFALVYYFYYIQRTRDVGDVFLLYYISSFISSLLMTIGLHQIRKRIRELEEVKNTRRELAMFFGS